MGRTIFHIDFDSFFASVEQQYNPRLRGKPIGVTATNGRTCIIASSREAKRLEIKTGCRTYEAKKICPQIIFVPANFIKYWEISKKFLRICKDYSPFVEVFSIDELFIDITKTAHLFGGTYQIIDKVKSRIKKEIGEYITVSIGVSYNKLLAKLASGLNKPDGIFEIKRENLNKVYAETKLTDLCGIGERIAKRLKNRGVMSLFDLRKISLPLLISEFGKCEAQILKNIAWGIDESSIIPYTSPPSVKSVGRNYCLPRNEYNKRVVLQNLYELCEEVGIKLRRLNKKARTVGISLRGNINIKGEKTYDHYFNTGYDIFHLLSFARFNLAKLLGGNYVRQISVWVKNLKDSSSIQISLFDNMYKKDGVQKSIDAINERFGDHTIRNGFLLYADKLTTVPNGYMADKYERAKLAKAAFDATKSYI